MNIPSATNYSYGKSSTDFDPALNTLADESRQDVEDVTSQVKKLIAQQLEQKNKTREKKVADLSKNLTEAIQKNESLLSEVDRLTRDCVAEVLRNMVLEVTLADTEDLLEKSENSNERIGMENLALVNYVKGDLLKLASITQAQDLLNQLNPPHQSDLAKVISDLRKVEATLRSLQEFDSSDPIRAHIMKVFSHLENKIEALRQASAPLDQPKLGLLLDRLRQHLIRHQIKQLRALLKECSQGQIQPISQDLKKDIEKLYGQVKKFIPKEDPSPISEGGKSTSWWAFGKP